MTIPTVKKSNLSGDSWRRLVWGVYVAGYNLGRRGYSYVDAFWTVYHQPHQRLPQNWRLILFTGCARGCRARSRSPKQKGGER